MKDLLPSIFKFYDRFTTEENTDKTKPLTIQKGERFFFYFTTEVRMQYQLKLQQLVTYSRCRIYRNFIRTLAEDTNIRLNGDSYLFYFMMLCSLANFRTSYMQVDGISYTIAPGEWMITSRDMMKLLRKKTMKSTMEVIYPMFPVLWKCSGLL